MARYPKVKEDQDYATRTVVSKFLSGEMTEDTAKIAASILEKPVNNITKVSILNSADDITPSKNVKKQAKKYNLDENPLDKYNGIKISDKEHWRIKDALNEELHNDTTFPKYVFVSIFNTKLKIDKQYCVRWWGFGNFAVIARGGKKLEKIRSIYDEYNRKRQTFLSDGGNGKSEYIRGRYNRDAFDVRDGRDDRRDDSLLGQHTESDRGKGSQSIDNSGKRGKVKLQKKRTSYAPTFYSKMERVIDDIKINKMGAGGVVSHLTGKGVKKEEINWSGIETFLEGKKFLTKEELQEFVKGITNVFEFIIMDTFGGENGFKI